jgi:TPR repeat protein
MPYSNKLVNLSRWKGNRISGPAVPGIYNKSYHLLNDNDAESFRLNAIAADSGFHDAVLAMGWYYLNGVGVNVDKDEAVRWYRKSARQGDNRAMFSLGYIAYLDKDYSEALTWFTRALKKEHHRSNFWIGKLYWRGHGVQQNRKLARDYFAKGAARKVIEAQRAVRFLSYLEKHGKSD